jgi:SPP1 gp7 family putative phage head morphogenesis protein
MAQNDPFIDVNALPKPPPVPSGDAISRLFLVDPAAAIEFFRSLGVRVVWNWRADETAARDLAFYISKVMEADVLAAIKEEIARALKLGIPTKSFRKFMLGRLAQLGWIGARQVVGPDGETDVVDISTPARIDLIFRTNAQTAYNAGRYAMQSRAAQTAPVWQYVAVMDSRTRTTHAAMNGKAFLATDAIWSTIYPPCGFNCRCRVRALTLQAADGLEILDGASFELPAGFPDTGFGGAAVAGAAQLGSMISRLHVAEQRAART